MRVFKSSADQDSGDETFLESEDTDMDLVSLTERDEGYGRKSGWAVAFPKPLAVSKLVRHAQTFNIPY